MYLENLLDNRGVVRFEVVRELVRAGGRYLSLRSDSADGVQCGSLVRCLGYAGSGRNLQRVTLSESRLELDWASVCDQTSWGG